MIEVVMSSVRSTKINKSQAIRDYKAANPTATPAEMSTALSKQGVKVSPQFVSSVLSDAKRKGKPGPKPAAPASGLIPGFNHQRMYNAFATTFHIESLVKLCGNHATAIEAVKIHGEMRLKS